jgi:hypothetical protein
MFLKSTKNPIRRRTLFVLLVEYPVIVIILCVLWWFFGLRYLIAGIIIFAFLFVLSWWARQPVKRSLNIADGNWRSYLEALLYKGFDRAMMFVTAPDGKHSMQFTKYLMDHGVVIQFQFPRAPWSTRYYEPLQRLLKERHYYFQIWPVGPQDKFDPEIDQFIVVSLEQSLEHAEALVKLVLLEIFKLDPSDNVMVWLVNKRVGNRKTGF